MRDRAFGVEIECLFPGGPYRAAQLLERSGFEEWAQGDIHQDGSGTEIPSPILRGAAGFRELQAVMALLRDNGATTTRSDGLHIHHDAPEFIEDDELVERLLITWAENQEVLSEFVAPYRRDDYWACSLMTPDRIKQMKDNLERYKASTLNTRQSWNPKTQQYERRPWKLKDMAGRATINVSSLDEHGTIEFRQMEGTLDFATAKSWIMFGQAFLDSVKKRKRPFVCADAATLMKRVSLARSAELVLAEKVANPRNPEGRGDELYYEEDYCGNCDNPYDYCSCCYECGSPECACERCSGCECVTWDCLCSRDTVLNGSCQCSGCVEEREWAARGTPMTTFPSSAPF